MEISVIIGLFLSLLILATPSGAYAGDPDYGILAQRIEQTLRVGLYAEEAVAPDVQVGHEDAMAAAQRFLQGNP